MSGVEKGDILLSCEQIRMSPLFSPVFDLFLRPTTTPGRSLTSQPQDIVSLLTHIETFVQFHHGKCPRATTRDKLLDNSTHTTSPQRKQGSGGRTAPPPPGILHHSKSARTPVTPSPCRQNHRLIYHLPRCSPQMVNNSPDLHQPTPPQLLTPQEFPSLNNLPTTPNTSPRRPKPR